MCCVGKTKALPHAGPGTNFHYANNARAKANPAPSTPAGWLCVAWLEDFDGLCVPAGVSVGVEVSVGTEGSKWEIQLDKNDIFRTDAPGTADITHRRPQKHWIQKYLYLLRI